MKKGDFVFVYGTLRKGERADLQKQARSFDVTFIGDDAINGEMFHIGSYPGIKLFGEPEIWDPLLPMIVGEVFLIRNAAIVAILDAYEGYEADDPTRGLYNRTQIETAYGRRVWVYTYNPPVRREQLIESGDWVKNQSMPISSRLLHK